MTEQPAPALRRSIGTRTATAFVIGNMVGSGVFLLPAGFASAAGPISIFAWIFTGIGRRPRAGRFAVLEAEGLECDEAMLSGESLPATKQTGPIATWPPPGGLARSAVPA